MVKMASLVMAQIQILTENNCVYELLVSSDDQCHVFSCILQERNGEEQEGVWQDGIGGHGVAVMLKMTMKGIV